MPTVDLSATVQLERLSDLIVARAPRPETLLDVHEQRNGIVRRLEDARARGLVALPELRPRRRNVVSLERHQTTYRDQGSRGTCYAFATVAAMEAAYKRAHGVELDLSEDFLFQLNKIAELFPFYLTGSPAHENNCSYSGGQGSSDLVAKAARSAICDEAAAPYRSDTDLEAIRTSDPSMGALAWGSSTQEQFDQFDFDERYLPTAARYQARYRVRAMRFLPSASRENVMAVIDAGYEVIADIPGHSFLIIGYDLNTQEWIVKNSWGRPGPERWPIATTSLMGGAYITEMEPLDAPRDLEATWIGRWNMNHDGWAGQLVLRRTQDYRAADGDLTKLGDYYVDGVARQVNGRTDDDGRQLHFWIADAPGRIAPGTQTGQEFQVYQFTREDGLAAGVTWWNGAPFGVTLSRQPITNPNSSGTSWQGAWEMNHDGWHGRLDITSTDRWAGTYTPEGGSSLTLRDVSATDGYQLKFSIPFSPENVQPFTLFRHTQEGGRFSGTTQWAGMTFGAQGRRALPTELRIETPVAEPFPHIG